LAEDIVILFYNLIGGSGAADEGDTGGLVDHGMKMSEHLYMIE